MRNQTHNRMTGRGFRFIDVLVILLCLSGAAYSFKLFWFDLFHTINSRNEKPLGIITFQDKTVKRQFRDSVRWDRLILGAPLYAGDLVQVAERSSVAFKQQEIEVKYTNYQMRRILPLAGDGLPQFEGNVIITAHADSIYYLNGSRVEAGAGTVIKAEYGEDGTSIQILEGAEKVKIGKAGKTHELGTGGMIDWDTAGNERNIPNVVVSQPRPNIRYLKNRSLPFSTNFVWKRVNMEPTEVLYLEIAEDPNFARIVYAARTPDESILVSLDTAGPRYWRFSSAGSVLARGYFSVVEAFGPVLISPIKNSRIYYRDSLPSLSFQWSKTEGALEYYLEVCETEDFARPRIRKQVAANFYIDSSLGPGIWYWHILPVFPADYIGSAVYSSIGSFQIEQGDRTGLVLPEPVVIAALPPELPMPEVVPPELPPPLLPAPGGRLPASGHRLGIAELRTRQIDFNWNQVPGANGYIITIYRQSANGLREISRTGPINRTRWSLTNLSILDNSSFIWQVEAVNSRGNTIRQRGRTAQNLFIMDIPRPVQPRIHSEGLRIEEIPIEGAGNSINE
jgi:hypothetical protein